jgi:hypothetical protein
MVGTDFRRYAVAQLVEAQRYKPEGNVLDPGWVVGIFTWLNPSSPGVEPASNRNE